MELWIPGLWVFQRSHTHTPKHLPLVWKIPQCWAPTLLIEAVLQVQLLVYFGDATRLQWKIPLPLSSFLLPYSLICFICNYLYRRDQQFINNGIKPTKLPRSYRLLEVHVRRSERERLHTPNLFNVILFLQRATGSLVPWGEAKDYVSYISPAHLPWGVAQGSLNKSVNSFPCLCESETKPRRG